MGHSALKQYQFDMTQTQNTYIQGFKIRTDVCAKIDQGLNLARRLLKYQNIWPSDSDRDGDMGAEGPLPPPPMFSQPQRK